VFVEWFHLLRDAEKKSKTKQKPKNKTIGEKKKDAVFETTM